MPSIFKKITPRIWILLLYIFLSSIVGAFASTVGDSICAFFLLPAAFMLVPNQFKGARPIHRNLPLLIAVMSLLWLFICVVFNFYRLNNHLMDGSQILTLLVLLFFWIVAMFPRESASMGDLHGEILSIGTMLNICYLPLTLLGLLSIFTGKVFRLPFCTHECGIMENGQLSIMTNPNNCGRTIVFCILFSVYALMVCRSKKSRIFNIACIILHTIALAHVQSRGCIFALCAACGMIAFRAVLRMPKVKRIRFLAAILAFALAFALLYLLIAGIYTLNMKFAPSPAKSRMINEAGLDLHDSGRFPIWKSCLDYLNQSKSRWIFGINLRSIYGRVERALPGGGVHNSYLDALMRGGIPYLLLMLIFLVLLVKPCWKLLTATEASNGAFIIPIFIVVLLMMGTTETGLFCGTKWMGLLFSLFAGYAFHLNRSGELYG